MASFGDNTPTVATHMAFAWGQSFGTNAVPPCGAYGKTLIFISVYDSSVSADITATPGDIDATQLGDGFVDGVALDFGPLASGAGYYFTNVDLTGGDPDLPIGTVGGVEVGVPSDGALEMALWDDVGAGPVPGSHSQPMLWAPKDTDVQGSWADGVWLLDGFSGPPVSCPAYDGEYLPNAAPPDQDEFALANDASWPGGCPSILNIMIGLYGEEGAGGGPVCAGDGTVIEGFGIQNTFAATCVADDTRWNAHGATFFYAINDPVVQFEMGFTAPAAGAGGTLSISVEASKESAGATQFLRARLFNYTTGAYVPLPGLLNLPVADAPFTYNLPAGGNPDDFIRDSDNRVQLLLQTIQTAGAPNVRTRLDQVLLNIE
jgi:hypothetical protein